MFRAIIMLCALSLPTIARRVVCGEMRTQADMNACQKRMIDAVNAGLTAINADVLGRFAAKVMHIACDPRQVRPGMLRVAFGRLNPIKRNTRQPDWCSAVIGSRNMASPKLIG